MKAQVISFNCVLKDPLGKVISSSFNHGILAKPPGNNSPPVTSALLNSGTQPGQFDFHEPLEGLVEGLEGIKEGERRTIFVNAERAYGFYDPELVMHVSRKKIPHGDNLEVGFQVVAQTTEGKCRTFRVIEVDASTVTLDGNHPLAGQDLCFDIETTAAREATQEELDRVREKPKRHH